MKTVCLYQAGGKRNLWKDLKTADGYVRRLLRIQNTVGTPEIQEVQIFTESDSGAIVTYLAVGGRSENIWDYKVSRVRTLDTMLQEYRAKWLQLPLLFKMGKGQF